MKDIQGFIRDMDVCMAQVHPEIIDFMTWLFNNRTEVENVLEIGIFEAATLRCWKYLYPDAYVLGMDIGSGGEEFLCESASQHGFDFLLKADSHSAATLELVKDREWDMLFIDGDHSYEGAKQDFEMYAPLVKAGGLVAMHDIKDTQHHRDNNCFVGQFWNEMKGGYETIEFCEMGTDWGGIGVVLK